MELDLNKVFNLYFQLLNGPDKETSGNFFFKCPYHTEKTPSFAVRKSDGIFKCFGCGKSGNIITLIKDLFPDQQEELFNYLGISFGNKSQGKKTYNLKDNLKKIIIQQTLPLLDDLNKRVGKGLEYLKNRGLNTEIIKRYNFLTLNENIKRNVLEIIRKDLEKKYKDKKEKIESFLNKYKEALDKMEQYFKGYLIIPVSFKSNFTNNYMFIGRNLDSSNTKKPRYKNEKLNKTNKTFYIGKANDNNIVIMEGAIDGFIYNYYTNKTINLLLGANKINFEGKNITFLTDNDESGFNFLGNLYDFNTLLTNNNVFYIFWSLSLKEIFKNFFFKIISEKYNYDLNPELVDNLIQDYSRILVSVKDINELLKFLLKLLYIVDITIGRNKFNKEQLSFDYINSFDFSKIPYEFIERKDIQQILKNIFIIFNNTNIEQNTFLIFFFYYTILKNKINLLNNIDISFFLDLIKEELTEIEFNILKEVLLKKKPYQIFSFLMYLFDLQKVISVLNILLFKSKKPEKSIFLNEVEKFKKAFKLTTIYPEFVFLLKKLNLVEEQDYKKLLEGLNKEEIIQKEKTDYDKLLKSKLFYGRIFTLPLIYMLFKETSDKTFLKELILKNNKDINGLLELIENLNKIDPTKFKDLRKFLALRNIFVKYVELNKQKKINNNLGQEFLSLFGLEGIKDLSEISLILKELNNKDIENNIKILFLNDIIKFRTEKDLLDYIDRRDIDLETFIEELNDILNEILENKPNLTGKTDLSIILNLIKSNEKKIKNHILNLQEIEKQTKIIFGILQSFISYI